MHLLIPFAAASSDGARAAVATLALPRLAALLARWREVERDDPASADAALDGADPSGWSPPHERARARALGWHGGAGQLPWAAWMAQQDGIDVDATAAGAGAAWGLVTPAHWLLGTDQVTMIDPEELMLDDATSRALFDAVRPLFTGIGWALEYGAPLRWYAAHESLAGFATASPDRVIGRNVDAWLGAGASARPLRRLQSEVQMLLHAHPVNVAREDAGLLPVNSFWISGCGVAQPVAPGADVPVVDDRLRRAALAEDWGTWQRQWQALDAGPIAELQSAPAPACLTLCGERASSRWAPPDAGSVGGWWRGVRARLSPADPRRLLEAL